MPYLPPPGRCIYCPSPGTSDEHIIPQSLGGKLILKEASCEDCRKITAEFERVVTREMYWPLRLSLGITGSRKHKRQRPTHWPGILQDGDKIENMPIPVGRLPRAYATLEFAPPGILSGQRLHEESPQMKVHIMGDNTDIENFVRESGAGKLKIEYTLQWAPFARMIAKICHAYAVSVVGLQGVEFFLPPLIRGESYHLAQFVGGVEHATEMLPPSTDLALGIRTIFGRPYLSARVTILGPGRFPTYEAVVGRIMDLDLIRTKTA